MNKDSQDIRCHHDRPQESCRLLGSAVHVTVAHPLLPAKADLKSKREVFLNKLVEVEKMTFS